MMLADELCGADASNFDSIHPPDVVLVSASHSHQSTTSSQGAAKLDVCSPLSTAPNSPFRNSYEEDDDLEEDDDEEVSPEEVQKLLDTPVSSHHKHRGSKRDYKCEVPFDERQTTPRSNTPRSNAAQTPRSNSQTNAKASPQQPFDPLLGNPRLYKSGGTTAATTPTAPPNNLSRLDDIDGYEEEQDDDDGKDEKKVNEPNDNTPPRPPISMSPRQASADFLAHYQPRMALSHALSEDDSVPHDERQQQQQKQKQQPSVASYSGPEDEQQQQTTSTNRNDEAESEFKESLSDFIETTREVEEEQKTTPMKKALRTAEREVQEMERRVQLMLEQRRQTSQRSQQKFVQDLQQSHVETYSDNDIVLHQTSSHEDDDTLEDAVIEIDGEPPSLSPPGANRYNINLSLDHSGEVSSYYYDGSVMASQGGGTSTSGDNNTSLDTTISSSSANKPKENTDYYMSGIRSPTFDAFTSQFDATSQAFHQVTDDLTNFLVGASSPTSDGQQKKKKKYKPPSAQQYPPVSPSSIESDCTPKVGHLSPKPQSGGSRNEFSTRNNNKDVEMDIFLRQRASAKLARARSLVSERQSKSPTSAPYLQQQPRSSSSIGYSSNANSNSNENDSMQRARQVMSKREQQPYQQPSLSRPSSTTKRSVSDTTAQQQQQQQRKSVTELRSQFQKSSSATANHPTKKESGDSAAGMNIPMPPSLHRIAAMMEDTIGGAEKSSADHAEQAARDIANAKLDASETADDGDWPRSVSQLVEEYQTAISASLRNMSIDEITGLAGATSDHASTDYGKGKMASPGVTLGRSRSPPPQELQDYIAAAVAATSAGNNTQCDPMPAACSPSKAVESDGFGDFVEDMTFGACLQMPELNHAPLITSRNGSTTQNVAQHVAGLLQCDRNLEYHVRDDEQPQLGKELLVDDEHQERAVFAKQLSERLMSLSPNTSTDKSGSLEDPSPERRRQELGISFVTNNKDSSSGTSPYKRSDSAYQMGKGAMAANMSDTKGSRKGLVLSNMPARTGELLPSGIASVSSDGYSWENNNGLTPDRNTPKSKPTSATKSFANIKPTMVESIDNETGVAKGDVMLSLLCDNSFQASKEKPDSWAWRVREAIWRGRGMRRNMFGGGEHRTNEGGDVPQSYSSLPVDVDDVRVVGGIQNVGSIQEKALAHMDRDEFEQALELYEDIIFNYYSFFEQVLAKRDEFSSEDVTMELSNFKPYIGASLHNLGIIHLLKGDYEDAFSFFKRAVDNRRACLGESHMDTVTSLVRLATCRFAMDNFADAHTNLELALALAGSKARTNNDYCQLGEILNNLGCLSYMCGQPTKAMKLFLEARDVQLAVLNSTLYGGTKYSAHSATLNISITRGNIGFLALVLKDVSSGIVALESALREQRLLLNGAHVTLVSTMDHLAVANLLEGRTQKAIKMLRRIYDLQRGAHGPDDPRTLSTRQKIMTIRGQQIKEEGLDPTRQSAAEEAKSPQSAVEPEAIRQSPQLGKGGIGMVEKPRSVRQTSESSSRCAADPRSSSSNVVSTGNGSSKVNSIFKSLGRSLGRKKA